jgi:hypothetical protein
MFYIPFLPRPPATRDSSSAQSPKLQAQKYYWGLNLDPHEANAKVVDITDLPPDRVQVEWRASYYLARSLAPGYPYAAGEWVTVICGENNYLWIEPQIV